MSMLTYALSAFGGGKAAQREEGLRDFLAQSAVRALLEKASGPNEDFMRSEMLLIFDTPIQHTWLVATNAALYCVFDNRRQPHARKLWRIARSDLEHDGKLIVQIGEAELTGRDNYLIVGGRRPRKFNKRLFETLTIKESIENMLCNAFQLQLITQTSG
jgi:hypothetical protein